MNSVIVEENACQLNIKSMSICVHENADSYSAITLKQVSLLNFYFQVKPIQCFPSNKINIRTISSYDI